MKPVKETYRFCELSKDAQIKAANNFREAWKSSGEREHHSIESAIEDLEFCDGSDRPDNEIPRYTITGDDA